MNRYYFYWIVLIALIGLFFTFFFMWKEINPPPQPKIVKIQPNVPFQSYIFGVGVVESSSDNISIGSPVNRIIEKVLVKVGTEVKKGEPLFQLENQDLKAELIARKVDAKIALAKEEKLEALPRHEDLAAAEANLKSSQVELEQAENQYRMVQGLQDSRAMSQQEVNRRRFNFEIAQARWKDAQANLEKVRAGAWKPDLEIAQLEVEQARAGVERVQAEIQRTIIRSPIDGEVLQLRIHAGEFPADVSATGPLMIVGNTNELYLKVSINQFDAPYFRSNAPAVAFLRGDMHIEFQLEFVRLEPYLVYKQNLTNAITEKVDTRVLQVVYRIKGNIHHIFVGQQMDVYIEAEFPS